MAQWSMRTARRSPAGFIRPCLPTLATKVPTGPEWIHELKYDGYRIIARKEGEGVRLWTRNGLNWAVSFPRIMKAIRALPVERLVLDGEAVCLRDDGHPDFHALRSKRGCRDACLMTFDLLGLDGSYLVSLPLHARRAQLAALIDGQVDALLFSGHVAGSQGEALFRHACAQGLEGIVSKKAESRYRSGPRPEWLKIKCSTYTR